jgi:dTDP-glucose 4,6-dehydratase
VDILVTGGAGFIGSHFVRSTLDNTYAELHDARVTVVDKLTYAGNLANLPADHPRLRFVEGDVGDLDLMVELARGIDAVVHFAAESHVDRSVLSSTEFFRTNVLGTQILLDACRHAKVPRIVHVSTDEVYGSIEEGSWTEQSPLLPNSPYAASKAAADLLVRSYWRTHGLDVSITRCSNNYGPYQHPEKMIPRFVTNLLQGEPLPLYGDGRNVRDWLHVQDHCQGIRLVLDWGRAGEIYNIGSGTELSNRELTGRLLEALDADWSMVRPVEDRKGHDLRYSLDDTKIRRELGYEASVGLDDGLAATVAWYRDAPDWWKPLVEGRAQA